MKKLLTFSLLIMCFFTHGQVLEVPTLKSKGLIGDATKVEINQFDFVNDKGLILTQSDVESYDTEGRLLAIDRKVLSSGLSYKYTYKLSRKGFLEEEKIINSSNNETVRTTAYDYKKGRLVKTTQVQGTITFIKNYSYNKNGHLIKMEAIENGASKGEELYQVDDEGRRTRVSQRLPTAEVATMISSYTYSVEENIETKTEIRNVNGVKYEIVVAKDLNANRNIKEVTKNLSTSESGFTETLFVDDDKGSWIKGEVVDNQFGRSRLVLKKITYSNGTVTGRLEMAPDDARARYYRQNSQYQVLYNGKVASTGTAIDILDSKDRLAYVEKNHSWVLMKGYDENAYQTTWHEAQIVTKTRDEVIWVHSSMGLDMYKGGKKLTRSVGSGHGDYSEYGAANTRVAFFGGDLKKSLVLKGIDKTSNLGNVNVANLTDEHNYWVKSSDTTYVLIGYGKYITIRGQATDEDGDNLVTVRVGDGSYYYLLPAFRERFDKGEPGDVFPVIYLTEPLKDLKENGNYSLDFSRLKHDNYKNGRYSLKTPDGQTVTGLVMPSQRTKDNELLTFFPLTKQYLKMDGYYEASEDEDLLDQPVTILLDGFKDGYYVYNDAANISFYQNGEASKKYRFGSQNLSENTKQYGAVLYDSIRKVSYGMNYDLALGDVMGPMKKLPINQYHVYLLKLENGNWVAFNGGGRIANYDYTAIDDGSAILFFKDHGNKISAYRFDGFIEAKGGDFIASHYITGEEAVKLSERLGVNPLKPIEKEKKP